MASLGSSYGLFLISCLFPRDKHNIRGNFHERDCHPFPSMEKKNHLSLVSGPSSLFYSISDQFVWIWANLAYSFGAYVKVCKVLGSVVL